MTERRQFCSKCGSETDWRGRHYDTLSDDDHMALPAVMSWQESQAVRREFVKAQRELAR